MQMKQKVYILGGGFGGLYTAMELDQRLAGDPNVEITLVNRDTFFLFTPMLHEVAASDLDLTTIYRSLDVKVEILGRMATHRIGL